MRRKEPSRRRLLARLSHGAWVSWYHWNLRGLGQRLDEATCEFDVARGLVRRTEMDKGVTIEELQTKLTPFRDLVDWKVQHVHTNDWYVVEAVQLREADLTVEVAYRTLHMAPVRFTRPLSEFVDGRFRFVSKVK